jgi:hypothetical protein
MKRYILLIALLLFGCAQNKVDLMDGAQYQRNHEWCMNYNTPGKTPVHTETYRQCMERFGYKYETP